MSINIQEKRVEKQRVASSCHVIAVIARCASAPFDLHLIAIFRLVGELDE
jgi:hypothetical protein